MLERQAQPALVGRAHAGQPPRRDLAALGHKLGQQTHVFVIDGLNFLSAELANLFAAEKFASALAGSAGSAAGRTKRTAFAASASAAGRRVARWCWSSFVSHDAP